jgi:hypothetical protein
MIQQIRLDDLLAREVDVRWFEAVALIQAVCRQGLASNGSGASFPSAADIVLDAGGRVSASAVGPGTGVAAAAAHILAGMLKDDVPVRLRLVVTQTTGGVGYKSLEEFSEALGYFERPDSEQTLKSLFDRASQAPNRALPPTRQESPTPPNPDPLNEPARPRRRRGSPLTVAAVATVLICGSVLWLVGSDARTARLAASFGIVEDAPTSDAAAPATSEGRKHRQERNRNNARSVSHTPDASTSKRSAGTGSRPEHQHPSVKPLLASNVSWIPNLLVSADSLAAQASHVPPGMVFYSSVEITASGDGTRGDRPETEGAHIYTRSDTGVTPPRSVYPKLPDESDLGPRLATQTVLELLIDPRGLVEHVKLRTPPRNIHEFMIVSAAKAWQFEPARLDGQPVRFRQLVHLNMQ